MNQLATVEMTGGVVTETLKVTILVIRCVS